MQELELISGYTVRVRGRGPFTFSHIAERHPELPVVIRMIELATGDTGTWPYDPPDTPPDPSDVEEWSIYVRWRTREHKNKQILLESQRDRIEFFKLNCIDVIKTPFWSPLVWAVNVGKWWLRLFGRVPDKILFRARYLKFMDVEVIRSTEDWSQIQQAGIVPEVTVQSVLDAAHRNFPGDVGRNEADPGNADGFAAIREAIDQYTNMGSERSNSAPDDD